MPSAPEVAPAPRLTLTHSHMVSSAPPRPVTGDGLTPSALTGVSYRWWLGHGRGNVGLGVGTLGYVMPSQAGHSPGADGGVIMGSAPTVTLGVRYSMTRDAALYADALGVRGLGEDRRAGYYNTQVGLEWKNALSRLGFENGAFGFKLDSGYKMSLKLRRNGVGLYFRSQF